MVDGLAGLDVRRDAREVHGVRRVRGRVEHVELPGQPPEGEVPAEKVPRGDKALEPHVARVAAEALVVPERAADLAGLVVAAERRARRDADHVRGRDALLEPRVIDALGIQAAEAAALEHHARRVRRRQERRALRRGDDVRNHVLSAAPSATRITYHLSPRFLGEHRV